MYLRHAATYLAEDTTLELSPQKTPHSLKDSSDNPSGLSSDTIEERDRNLQDNTKKVYLAGIFDTEGFHWGPELFKIVVDLLNNHNDGWHDDIFNDGTQIEYLIGNSACHGVQAAQAYWDVRTQFDGLIHGVVGCRCSSASMTVATLAGLEEVCMISPSATSEKLSNTEDYPFFSRVVSPDNERGQVGALVKMLRAFGWKRVSIITTDKQYSRDLSTEFQRLWVGDENENGGDIAYQSPAIKIKANNDVDRSSVEQALQSAPTDDPTINSRIILLFGHSEHASQILQIAKEMKFQSDSVWVGPQAWVGRLPLEPSWIPPVPGYIGVTPFRNSDSAYQDILGRIAEVQAAEGKEVWSELPNFAAEYMIDSIVAMAKALSSVPHEDRRNGTLVTERLRQQTLEDGVSGQVRFTAEGDRRDPQFSVSQLQRKEGELMWVDTGSITVGSSDSSQGMTDIDFGAVCFAKEPCGKIPSDSYPVPRDPAVIWVPAVLSTILLGFLALGVKHWRSKKGKQKYRQKLAQLAKQLGKQMQGMVEAIDDLPVRSAEEYEEKIDMAQRDSRMEAVSWYWEEDAGLVGEQRNVLTGTNFVGYQDEISNQIEHAYQLWKEGQGFQQYDVDLTGKVQKLNNAHTGLRYQIDFEAMRQRNAKSSYERQIHREENQDLFVSKVAKILPELPPDVDFSTDGENLLPTIKGQVIQISKIHPVDANWAYGNVLFDPLLHEAILDKPAEDGDSGLNAALMKALHNRPTSGWFPKNAVTKDADVNVMQKLLGSLGGGGAGIANLSPPQTWATDNSKTATVLTGRIEVSPSTSEYDEVVNYFTSALYSQKDKVTVLKVERNQNLPLWQSYAVKRQTVKARDAKNPEHRLHNPHLDEDERRWLFHGTTHDALEKIETQGFNRAFAGKNAVAYGKGVYFARDASYSASKTYSEPDAKGVQRIFLSRVVVGDWCKGSNGQLTPDPKPHNKLELFDSTVDNVTNPSIFVVFSDSQAYPEYLVSFKSRK